MNAPTLQILHFNPELAHNLLHNILLCFLLTVYGRLLEDRNMATVKKGMITVAREWWKHLRPFEKRKHWKRERKAAKGANQT